MGTGLQERVAWLVWMAGLLWFAGSGSGLGRALWAAWTAGGLVILLGRQERDPTGPLAFVAAVLVMLGVSWGWALEPRSWFAASRLYLTALFWGALLGSFAGIAFLLRMHGRRYR